MANPDPVPLSSIRAAIEEITRLDAVAAVSDAEIQALMELAVRLYARRAMDLREQGDAGLRCFPPESEVSATEVMLTAAAMLKAANLQVFELGMFQAWAGH